MTEKLIFSAGGNPDRMKEILDKGREFRLEVDEGEPKWRINKAGKYNIRYTEEFDGKDRFSQVETPFTKLLELKPPHRYGVFDEVMMSCGIKVGIRKALVNEFYNNALSLKNVAALNKCLDKLEKKIFDYVDKAFKEQKNENKKDDSNPSTPSQRIESHISAILKSQPSLSLYYEKIIREKLLEAEKGVDDYLKSHFPPSASSAKESYKTGKIISEGDFKKVLGEVIKSQLSLSRL